MFQNRVSWMLIASTLAFALMLVFQVKWMIKSKALIEEAFGQKVQMAMTSAIGNLSDENCAAQSCVLVNNVVTCIEEDAGDTSTNTHLQESLDEQLAFYGIGLPYQAEILDKEKEAGDNDPFCCSLEPIVANKDQALKINFPEKSKYVFKQMGIMMIASILIMLFLVGVLLMTNYKLLKQKKQHQVSKDFFNNMAHEFKTPLTNIGLASSLIKKDKEGQINPKYLSIIEAENKKLQSQVERILHVAQIENGQYVLQTEEVDVKQMLDELILTMDLNLQNKGAKVNINLPDQTLILKGDPFHIRHVFKNLIDNALKYSKDQPIINIDAKLSDNGITIKFSDNGIGISKADQEHVFEKFQRVGTGNLHNQAGFGIGLYYSKMIVELHNGAIKLFSELGKGSQFDLFFPSPNR